MVIIAHVTIMGSVGHMNDWRELFWGVNCLLCDSVVGEPECSSGATRRAVQVRHSPNKWHDVVMARYERLA